MKNRRNFFFASIRTFLSNFIFPPERRFSRVYSREYYESTKKFLDRYADAFYDYYLFWLFVHRVVLEPFLIDVRAIVGIIPTT